MWYLHAWIALSLLPKPIEIPVEADPLEADIPRPFVLANDGSITARFARVRVTDRYQIWSVRYPSPIVSPDPINNVVPADYYRPNGPGPFPGVVVLHILGSDFALSRFLAARLADANVAALFVKLPYYGERRPPEMPRRPSLTRDRERTLIAMRQGICDVRRGIDVLASLPEIDPDRLGVTGISLGGIVSSVVAGVDPQVGRVVLLLAGGDLATILWESSEREAVQLRRDWTAQGQTRDDLDALVRPFDPLTHAEGLRTKAVFLMAGRADRVVPPESTRRLWDAAGRPDLTWFDCGHYSAVAYLLPAIRRTVAHFQEEPERWSQPTTTTPTSNR